MIRKLHDILIFRWSYALRHAHFALDLQSLAKYAHPQANNNLNIKMPYHIIPYLKGFIQHLQKVENSE